nr:zinc finger, CCHC-type [Tanacetum cinerariifolium]
MGDENPRRTLGDYSRPRHEGYRNTIELPDGNNLVPLRSDTIRLVQTDAHSTDFGLSVGPFECDIRYILVRKNHTNGEDKVELMHKCQRISKVKEIPEIILSNRLVP